MNDGFTRDFNIDDLAVLDPGMASNSPIVKADSKVIPEFFNMQMRDQERTLATGSPKYREIEMVRIYIPGDKNNVVEKRVTHVEKQRFPKHYEAFKKKQEMAPDGMLVEQWPYLTRSQVYEMKAINIFTVEQIAGLSDEQLSQIGIGGRVLRKYAIEYLAAAQTGAPSAQLLAENEAMRNQISLLTHQMSDLARRLESTMLKAGEKPHDSETNPLANVRNTLTQVTGTDHNVEIPNNYASLGIAKLKELCAKFTSTPVRTREEGVDLVTEYLGKKASFSA